MMMHLPTPQIPTYPVLPLNPTDVTSPPASYSDSYSNGVTYQYVWQIDIQGSLVYGANKWCGAVSSSG